MNVQAPPRLKALQEWFGSILSQPLIEEKDIQPLSPSGSSIIEEASLYIAPSPTLKSHQRIELYNQQYWWRFFKILQENYPVLTRFFGIHGFNALIAIPYILKYPMNHWSIALLGDKLPQWILEEYKESDRQLLYDVATMDLAFVTSFMAPQLEPIDLSSFLQHYGEEITKCTFYLQQHLLLFEWDYHLFKFRKEFLEQEPEHWTNHPFPELLKERKYYFVFSRNAKHRLVWREIKKGEWLLLTHFKKGTTIEAVCEEIEENESLFEGVEEGLEGWIQAWTALGWLTRERPSNLLLSDS